MSSINHKIDTISYSVFKVRGTQAVGLCDYQLLIMSY